MIQNLIESSQCSSSISFAITAFFSCRVACCPCASKLFAQKNQSSPDSISAKARTQWAVLKMQRCQKENCTFD